MFVVCRPSQMVHRQKFVVRHSSQMVHYQRFVVCHPSQMVHCLWSVCHPSQMVHYQRFVVCHPSQMVHCLWSAIHLKWSIVKSLWSAIHLKWSIIKCLWSVVHLKWSIVKSLWSTINLKSWSICRRGRVGKGVGHLDHVWSYGVRKVVSSIPDRGNIVGWVFHPTRWLARFSLIWKCLSFQILNLFRTFSSWGSGNYRPSPPLYEVASHVKQLPFRPLLLLLL